MNSATASSAWREWESVLGHENLVCDHATLGTINTATFETPAKARASLRPRDRQQVQECMRIAQRHRVSLYPVSTGRNWGYGSAVPVRDAVLLDLSRLNRIVDYDEELAAVTVEPGVTQGQLYEFLAQKGSKLWMDATGAGPNTSIIGNTLERGFGHTPLGERCANVCGFEVVLPTGDCIHTGTLRFPGSMTGQLSRWGIGPSLDGLFAQSNLGIVTRMSVWLMPRPDYIGAFFFKCDALGGVVDALRPLRLNGTIRSVVHIANDYKVLSAMQQYPWTETAGATPLHPELMAEIRRHLGIGRWNASGGLYGTRRQVLEARSRIKRSVSKIADRFFWIDDSRMRWMDRAEPLIRRFSASAAYKIELVRPVYGLLKGVPTDAPLASTYWRKRMPVPADRNPDRDGCGLLWCSPLLPSRGRDAEAVADRAAECILKAGFEPIISVSMTTERTLACIIAISYDRSIAGEDDRAWTCYERLTEWLTQSGYPPYRLNVRSMKFATSGAEYTHLIRAIKSAFDPSGILAAGRYTSLE
jgi:4-cresol dehydrogenase (hydroxylating) flavoprotein subunit